ncbi:MAG: glucose dehydrogenase, partial [Rhodobacteraceae bacterium]|nr:glucose dehydrogenase [Paracoccaceae bacterium]
RVFQSAALRGFAEHPFPSVLSDRVKKIGAPTVLNRVLTDTAGFLLDTAGPLRGKLIDTLIAEGPTLDVLLANPEALRRHVAENVVTTYHPCGTCRMGAATDPASVVDGSGKVRGMENLRVADSSVFPDIPRNNINLPVIMLAERMADLIAKETGGA